MTKLLDELVAARKALLAHLEDLNLQIRHHDIAINALLMAPKTMPAAAMPRTVRQLLLADLATNGEGTSRELAARVGCSHGTVASTLSILWNGDEITKRRMPQGVVYSPKPPVGGSS